MENVRQIYQAFLLLCLDMNMEGYEQPEALMAIAEKVRWLACVNFTAARLYAWQVDVEQVAPSILRKHKACAGDCLAV